MLVILWIIPQTHAAESEPNNTRAQTNALTLSAGQGATSGRVNPLSDLDFFSITTPAFTGQATLVITMTPTSAGNGLDARVQLQSSTGTLLADRDVGYDDAPETLTFSQAVGSTIYYVVCRSADFVDAGSGEYTLQVALPFDDDSNDQISGAGTVGTMNRTVTGPGVIGAPTDVDLFSFTVAAGQRISFDIDHNSGFDSRIFVCSTRVELNWRRTTTLAVRERPLVSARISNTRSRLQGHFTWGCLEQTIRHTIPSQERVMSLEAQAATRWLCVPA